MMSALWLMKDRKIRLNKETSRGFGVIWARLRQYCAFLVETSSVAIWCLWHQQEAQLSHHRTARSKASVFGLINYYDMSFYYLWPVWRPLTSLLETKNVIPQAGSWIFLHFAVLPTIVAKKLPRFRPTYLFRSTGFIGDWIRNVRKKSHLQSLKSPFSRLNAKRPLDSMTKPSFGDRDNFILMNYCKLSAAISYSSSVV